jgi:hypothetical protein
VVESFYIVCRKQGKSTDYLLDAAGKVRKFETRKEILDMMGVSTEHELKEKNIHIALERRS